MTAVMGRDIPLKIQEGYWLCLFRSEWGEIDGWGVWGDRDEGLDCCHVSLDSVCHADIPIVRNWNDPSEETEHAEPVRSPERLLRDERLYMEQGDRRK